MSTPLSGIRLGCYLSVWIYGLIKCLGLFATEVEINNYIEDTVLIWNVFLFLWQLGGQGSMLHETSYLKVSIPTSYVYMK